MQSMKCDNLFIDSCPVCWISRSYALVHFGWAPSQLPNTLLCVCVKHWVVDRCVFYRLLNAYVFTVSAPQMPLFFPRVREILWFAFAKCGMFRPPCFTFSMILTLLWSARIVLLATLVPRLDVESCSATKALCMWRSVQKKDCTTCLQTDGVWSLSPEKGWDEDAIHFCSL